MSSKTLMLSIHPKYAEMIFDGSKKVELRRVKPNLSEKDNVVIYVTSPKKQIQGEFVVERIVRKPLNELWSLVQYESGLSREEFFNYFEGLDYGYGIFIGKTENSLRPIDLHKIREHWNNFNPPQSYRYLSKSEVDLLQSI